MKYLKKKPTNSQQHPKYFTDLLDAELIQKLLDPKIGVQVACERVQRVLPDADKHPAVSGSVIFAFLACCWNYGPSAAVKITILTIAYVILGTFIYHPLFHAVFFLFSLLILLYQSVCATCQ